MDPIEKKFREAFADYQFPVDDGLWDQVLEKKNRRKPFPWMRLAAALALLVVAGFLLWPTTSQKTDLAEQSSPVFTSPTLDVVPQHESTESPRIVQDMPVQAVAVESNRKPKAFKPLETRPASHTETMDIVTYDQDIVRPANLLPGKGTIRPDRLIQYEQTPIQLPNSIRVTQPDRPVYAANPIKKGISTVKHDLEAPDDLTGPARLVGTLQKASPKLFKDILAFSSAESTEIEINW